MSAMRKLWKDPTIAKPATATAAPPNANGAAASAGQADPWAGTASTETTAPAAPPAKPGQQKVVGLQRALQMLGYDPGTIDGEMGPNTKAAIKRLQQANNLPADGCLNGPTQAAMAKEMKTKGAAALGALANGLVAAGGAALSATTTAAKTVVDALPAHASPKTPVPDNRPTAGELVEQDVMTALSKRAYDLGYNDQISNQTQWLEIKSWDEVVAKPSRFGALNEAYWKGFQTAIGEKGHDIGEADHASRSGGVHVQVIKMPNADGVDLPTSTEADPEVDILKGGKVAERMKRSDVLKSPDYVDNAAQLMKAKPDLVTLEVKTMNFTGSGSAFDVEMSDIVYSPQLQPMSFERRGKIIYPRNRTGVVVFDPLNSPNIVNFAK